MRDKRHFSVASTSLSKVYSDLFERERKQRKKKAKHLLEMENIYSNNPIIVTNSSSGLMLHPMSKAQQAAPQPLDTYPQAHSAKTNPPIQGVHYHCQRMRVLVSFVNFCSILKLERFFSFPDDKSEGPKLIVPSAPTTVVSLADYTYQLFLSILSQHEKRVPMGPCKERFFVNYNEEEDGRLPTSILVLSSQALPMMQMKSW